MSRLVFYRSFAYQVIFIYLIFPLKTIHQEDTILHKKPNGGVGEKANKARKKPTP